MSIVFQEWKNVIQEQTQNTQQIVPSVPLEDHVDENKSRAKDNIRKIDNLLPEEMYDKFLKEMSVQKFSGGWASNKTTDPHGHWNCNFLQHDTGFNLADKTGLFINPVAEEIWNWVKENVPEFKDKIILRCYMNAHTYGLDGYFHTDARRPNEKTLVVYVLEDEWDKDWGNSFRKQRKRTNTKCITKKK